MNTRILRFSSVFWLVTGALFFFGVGETSSQEGKIGYVDSVRLRSEFKDFADAQAKLDQDVKTWQEEITSAQQVIDSMKNDLDKTGLMLSDAKKKEKEQNLESKKTDYQRLTNEVFGPGGRAERRNAELTKPILDKINQVLEKIATEENYAIIFDSVNGNIAYAKKNLDITDQVLEELKKLQ
ncbi:MAG: OmpH family outer membrane protein [Candidatus Zixiibacteriota bacterium]